MYKLGLNGNVIKGNTHIPPDPQNRDYTEYLEWLAKGNTPLPADPPPQPETILAFDKPVKAPDFIVATPKINADPEAALDEAIAETEKGDGSEKSIALIVLSLAKYLKAKRDKLK